MPSPRLSHFRRELARARDLVGLGQSLGAMTHGLVDASDIFRAALVQAVSALDAYIHGVVLDRAVAIVLGSTTTSGGTPARSGLSFAAIQQILSANTAADRELAARTHCAQRLSTETYQRPDDISNALALVGIKKVWSTAFSDAEAAKTALSLVVDRRNRIVHQCDADPLTPGSPTPLADTDALDAITTIESTAAGLDQVI